MEVGNESMLPFYGFRLPVGMGGGGGNGVGKWRWKSDGWGVGEELWDGNGVKVARAQWYRKPVSVEVFVPLGDAVLELVVLSALAVMAGDKKGLKIVGELVGGLMG